FQPTPSPWSARQAQMSSRITWSLLTRRLTFALPTCGPPIRKNTSWTAVGRLAVGPCAFFVPEPITRSALDSLRARVDRQARDVDVSDVGDLDRHRTLGGGQGREAQT